MPPRALPAAIIRTSIRLLLPILLLAYVVTGTYHTIKPLPQGLNYAGPLRPVQDVRFLADYTFIDPQGQRRMDQQIFDEFIRLISQARRLIVLDMFLLNDFQGPEPERHRLLANELTQALISRKRTVPDLQVLVITDPLNTVYGGRRSPHLQALEEAGIQVILTDLSRLRDSNPSWSALWRLCCEWMGNDPDAGWLPNPLATREHVTLRSYLALVNFKTNHRKTLLVDQGREWVGLVTSGNAHDASSAHGNTALRFSGPAALDLLETELAVTRMSGHEPGFDLPTATRQQDNGGPRVQVLTESRILQAVLVAINGAGSGDQISIAQFYFSHRELLEALREARKRGVHIRVLLDPNKDSFGRDRNGAPNRQTALELHRAGIPVRWCDTHGEQCHSKMMLLNRTNGSAELILGSANYTRRNLNNYNLETNLRVLAPDANNETVIQDALTLFENRWQNEADRHFSVPYREYADASRLRYLQYRLMEFSGWGTF